MQQLTNLSLSYDALVVGAGPAGAATAMLLARAGASVLLIDRNLPGVGARHAELLGPESAALLAEWGIVEAIARSTPALHRTTTKRANRLGEIVGSSTIEHAPLYAPLRSLVDPLLVDAAIAAGVQTRFVTSLIGLLRDSSGRVTGARLDIGEEWTTTVRARFVIGADGRSSATARLVGADILTHGGLGISRLCGLIPCTLDEIRHHQVEGMSLDVLPTNDGLTSISASTPFVPDANNGAASRSSRLRSAVATLAPDLFLMIASRRFAGAVVEHAARPRHQRRASGPGWALVGDARASSSGIAHGIASALQDAVRLADSIRNDIEWSAVAYAGVEA